MLQWVEAVAYLQEFQAAFSRDQVVSLVPLTCGRLEGRVRQVRWPPVVLLSLQVFRQSSLRLWLYPALYLHLFQAGPLVHQHQRQRPKGKRGEEAVRLPLFLSCPLSLLQGLFGEQVPWDIQVLGSGLEVRLSSRSSRFGSISRRPLTRLRVLMSRQTT